MMFLLLKPPLLWGEENQARLISSVQILGNITVSSATILAKIKSKAGQPFSQKELDEDLKRLYATGYFSDIKIDLRETTEGVAVIFNVKERPIIENISFEGKEKEFVTIVGKSGAGKTTLLKLLLGEESPTRGRVFFDNQD
ncbi:MAG: ATP-binding cassette domain-containing protein, partial [Candidatus Omnitrophica bacterium]|nr:ATP-binding cassette domain-containing protein [Candidatus Omnitrophota bacterium]